jgi:O-antigen/teichoic acid export membrane protein
VISFSLFQYSLFILRGLQLFKLLAVYSAIYSGACLLIALICVKWPKVELLLIATYIAQLSILPLIWIHIKRITRLNRRSLLLKFPFEWGGILRFSIVIYLTVLVDQIVWQRSEIFFLAQLPDAGQSGIYSLAFTVALVGVGIIPSAITGVMTPVFTNEMASEGVERLRQVFQSNFTMLNWLTLPLSMGMFFFAPFLLSDFFGDEYSSAGKVLMILVCSSAVAVYSKPSASILHALKLPKVLLIGSLFALPLDLYFAWRLVPDLGAVGAAVANLIAQTTAGLIAIGFVIIRVQVKYSWKMLGKPLLGTLSGCFAAWLVVAFIPIPILRIIAAAISGLLVYIVVLYKLNEAIATHIVRQIRKYSRKYFVQFSSES